MKRGRFYQAIDGRLPRGFTSEETATDAGRILRASRRGLPRLLRGGRNRSLLPRRRTGGSFARYFAGAPFFPDFL